MYFKRHRDDAYFDEASIKIIPRYKTSSLSGDEWRVSALLELKRKGMVLFEQSFNSLESAIAFLPGTFIRAREDIEIETVKLEESRELCMQPGCSIEAASVYRLKSEYCREGHRSDPPTIGAYRRFCKVHLRRGDCGLEDADGNYDLVSGPGPDEAQGWEDYESPSSFGGSIVL